jgi:hypothetical protein
MIGLLVALVFSRLSRIPCLAAGHKATTLGENGYRFLLVTRSTLYS